MTQLLALACASFGLQLIIVVHGIKDSLEYDSRYSIFERSDERANHDQCCNIVLKSIQELTNVVKNMEQRFNQKFDALEQHCIDGPGISTAPCSSYNELNNPNRHYLAKGTNDLCDSDVAGRVSLPDFKGLGQYRWIHDEDGN